MSKTYRVNLLVALIVSLLVLPAVSCAPDDASSGDTLDIQTASEAEVLEHPELSGQEIANILFVREEEKLARDVYLHLYEQWGNQVFSNIAGSEQSHMDSMLALIQGYGLVDPVGEKPRGQFTDAFLQQLHDNLVTTGEGSLLDAFNVGGLIEETDISDLDASIEQSEHDDILATYAALRAGSVNHLRAFAAQIERITGEPYQAQALSDEQVDEILDVD